MIDSQFVGNSMQRFTQQSVIVQRTDEILHDALLLFRQVNHAHLLLQLVVERQALAVDHGFTFFLVRHTALIDRQVLIVTSKRLQGLVQGRLTLLLFVGISILRLLRIFHILRKRVAFVRRWLQRRVIVHLSLNALHQLRHGQLRQLRL